MNQIRTALILQASKLLGIPYKFGAEWKNFNQLPTQIDCSELVEGVYSLCGIKIPDGSAAQFNFCKPLEKGKVQPGDLAFFSRNGGIYHVGMVYDNENIIEARAFDPKASFKTGEVILRPKARWEAYVNFAGYRIHPELLVQSL